MAGFQSTRSRVGFFTDDIDDWMAQRNAQLATREEDEAAGRLAWGAATRDGQSLAAPRPGDVIALGASTASSGAAPAGGVADVEPEQTGGDAIKPLQPAEPYPTHGMGSHWFSRDATWPAFLGGERLPSSFIESRYNVWKPVGATRGQVAEGHYLNDFRFGGGRLRDAKGKGSGWSGKRLAWEKNPPLVRFIERMPAVTKGTLAGIGLAASDTARGGGGQR